MINNISNYLQVNNPRINKTLRCTKPAVKNSDASLVSSRPNMYGTQNSKSVSFGGLFSSLFVKKATKIQPDSKDDENISPFAKAICEGANKEFGTNFPAKNFRCILPPDEFRTILPLLTPQNFEYNEENVKNGVYCADLDNQCLYSGGNEDIFTIMNKVASFANRYHYETGKDFIFALTDRDSLDGVKHAMKIIGENPTKYKHVKFIPGIKMSFAHKAPSSSSVGYENSEMLVYGINPFSEKVNSFLDSVIERRKAMTADFIKSVSKLYPEFAFDIAEFVEQNGLFYKKDFTQSNLYWRAKEYSEKKGGDKLSGHISSPERIVSDSLRIVHGLDRVFLGSDLSGSVSSVSSSLEGMDFNLEIRNIFDKYSTHFDKEEQKEVSAAENIYGDLIKCLSGEMQKPVLAFASPYYYSHYFEETDSTDSFDNVIDFFNTLMEQSDGMLCAFESIVPAYGLDNILGSDTIDKFNEYIRKSPRTSLYEVGGSFHRIE